jgi:hypothetical protein
MKKQWLVTVGAVATASLVQAQGLGNMGNAWTKYQDKISPVKEYSATMIMEVGGQTMTTKTFKSEKKTRTEITMQGMQAITILDPDADSGKGAMYMLMPMMKTYTKTPFSAEMTAANKTDAKETDFKIEELGKEQVDDVACDKRRITVIADGNQTTMMVWASPAAKNMPVKIEMTTPTVMVIKFKDYDFKKPSNDLFKVPADYKVNDMGGMMMGMPPGGANTAREAAREAAKEAADDATKEGVNRALRRL